jgi:hypothetical protein
MSTLLLNEAARLRREQLLEEAAAARLAGQAKDAERSSHRFFGWISKVWAGYVDQIFRGGSVKGACCA